MFYQGELASLASTLREARRFYCLDYTKFSCTKL